MLCLLVIGQRTGQAQVVSNPGNVALNALVQDSLAVTVSAPNVNFSLVPGTGPTAGAPAVTVTTTWKLHPGGSPTLSLYGFFSSSTAALSNGPNTIPSANVLAGINGGAPAAFTQTGPFGAGGASLQIYSLLITGINKNGTRSDTLDLYINLTSQPNLPAGTYTGILSLQAQAF
jgi:hypothetical protein